MNHRHANPVFFLLPGFGFGFRCGEENSGLRIEQSVTDLRHVATRASRLICGVDKLSTVITPDNYAAQLFCLWETSGGGPCHAQPLDALFRHGLDLDFKDLIGGTKGVRQIDAHVRAEEIMTALSAVGCSLVADPVPAEKTPIHFLDFCRHPYVLSPLNGVIGEGKGLNEEDGRIGALCEGVERVVALNPDYDRSFVGYSRRDLMKRGLIIPEMESGLRDCFSDDLLIDWFEAKLFPNLPAALPAEVVWFKYASRSGFRAFDMRHTIGLAAGVTEAEAFSNGLLECIERDAYAILMRCRLSCPEISVDDVASAGEDVQDVLLRLSDAGIEVHFKWLLLDYPTPIAHVFLRDKKNRIPAHSHGCSAGFTPSHAIARALFEAVQVHHGLARFAVVNWPKMAGRYESSHSDPRLAWGDPLHSSTLEHLVNGPSTKPHQWTEPQLSIEELCADLARKGRRVFWSKLGNFAGLSVVRTFLEGSVSPDGRFEDLNRRLADWVQRCKIPGPYTDPILT